MSHFYKITKRGLDLQIDLDGSESLIEAGYAEYDPNNKPQEILDYIEAQRIKSFYKIDGDVLSAGQGKTIPDGFVEYDPEKPPQDFVKAMKAEQQKRLAEKRRDEIIQHLVNIDERSKRAMREIAVYKAGSKTHTFALNMLKTLDADAVKLRTELQGL